MPDSQSIVITPSIILFFLCEKLEPDVKFIIGVGNKARTVSDKVELSFMVYKCKFTHAFHGLHNEHDVIIGMDFMSAHGATIDFKEATIRFDDVHFKLNPHHHPHPRQ